MKIVRPSREEISLKRANEKASEIIAKIKQDPSYVELDYIEGGKLEKLIAETLREYELMDASKL